MISSPIREFALSAAVVAVVFLAVGPAELAAVPPALSHGSTTDRTKEPTTSLTVTNVFYETSLRQALSDISAQVGVPVIPEPSVRGVVTCDLRDVPLKKALEIVLAGTNYIAQPMDGYYLVCSVDPESPSFSVVSQTKTIHLDYLKATGAIKLLAPAFQKYCSADPESNLLCVTACPDLIQRIQDDLAQFDRPPQHVLLEARIMALENVGLLNMGIQWTWPTILMGAYSDSDHHGNGLTPAWPWGIRVGYTPEAEFTGSLALTLEFLRQSGQATLIANPQVMAQDGESAEIRVNTEEYFEIVSEGIYITSQLEKIETGTVLKMTPHVGSDGTITLALSTEVSDVAARGENDLPVVSRRVATSTIRIQDGGTAVIAGLQDTKDQAVYSRVPGIWKVPLLGRLGQRENSHNTSRQVAIFVTARLMGMPDDARCAPGGPPEPLPPVDEHEFRRAIQRTLAGVDQVIQ